VTLRPATDPPRRRWTWSDASRAAEVGLGFTAAGGSIVVLANPHLSPARLAIVLGLTLLFTGARTLTSGGSTFWFRNPPGASLVLRAVRLVGLAGLTVVTLGVVIFVLLEPTLGLPTLVFLIAFVLIVQGLGRLAAMEAGHRTRWVRASSFAAVSLSVVLAIGTLAYQEYAILALTVLLGLLLLVNGLESIVAGLQPDDPRQIVLLKLLLFSALYGLVLINWIDLFGKQVPAYGIWLILTYMAPFGVLIVFEGWDSWPLAVSLGLLVSLMNDVGYYFVGNLLFGFHENLGPWILGQLGFEGTKLVTIFEGGTFSIPVTSWMMGASIWGRAAVVVLVLYYWWRNPTMIVARTVETPVGRRPVGTTTDESTE
jgi:uncharacterized membrane protein HdeD (DUF308 family)